jgi:hypothetical protein
MESTVDMVQILSMKGTQLTELGISHYEVTERSLSVSRLGNGHLSICARQDEQRLFFELDDTARRHLVKLLSEDAS